MVYRSLLVVLIIGFAAFYARDLNAKRTFSQSMPELKELPSEFAGWTSEDYQLAPNVAEVLAANVTLHRRFSRPDGVVAWLFVAYFAEQQVNSQIHSPRNCVPGSGWKIRSIDQKALPISDGMQATHMVIGRERASQDVLYWFRTRGGTVTGEYSLKWDLVKNSLARRPTDAVFIRYSCASTSLPDMLGLIQELEEPLDQMLTGIGLR